MISYRFQQCRIDYYPEREYCETIFEDGAICPASPHDTAEYRQRARDLGYGDDVMAMALDHETLHTALAEMDGEPYSQTLFAVAHGLEYAGAVAEEGRVMQVQRAVAWLKLALHRKADPVSLRG